MAKIVIPAKAGIQNLTQIDDELDSCFRRNDRKPYPATIQNQLSFQRRRESRNTNKQIKLLKQFVIQILPVTIILLYKF